METKSETALTKTAPQGLVIRDLDSLRIEFDTEKYNVMAPVVHMPGGLPAGTRLMVTEVRINPDPATKEVFPLPGGALMPGKVALDRLSNAAGISWIEERRQDNGSHPHYCEMFVRGRMIDFDGTHRELTGVKAIDLREDAGGGEMGKDYAEIVGKASAGNRDPSKQLMEARKFIQEIAASKAKNRAIASGLGIKRSYTKAELLKPFIVPRLSIDPSNVMAQNAIMASMLGETAVRAMFGPAPSQQKVIEAHVVEDRPAEVPSDAGGGEESAGDVSPPPTDSDPPSMTPPGKPTAEERKARLSLAWKILKQAGLPASKWGEFVRTNTNKRSEDEFTWEDLDLIDGAAEAFAEL